MKNILLINDVVGGSHVGMCAMLPILTKMGHSVFNLPTALVSNTLDYGDYEVLETTKYMSGTIEVWRRLGFSFDGVITGLMFSPQQAAVVREYCRELRNQGAFIMVDPIMGDGGRPYNGIGETQIKLMRQMMEVCDLAVPNLTEACLLAGVPYKNEGFNECELIDIQQRIHRLGAESIVITSALMDGKNCVSVSGQDCCWNVPYKQLPAAFHGTGDIFSALLLGSLMSGKALREATEYAISVVSSLIERNMGQQDPCRGIPIEACLDLI